MYRAAGVAARAHSVPTLGCQMVEGRLSQDRAAGIAGAQKKNVQGLDQSGIEQVKTMKNIQTDSYTGWCQADFRALLGVSGAALGGQIPNQVLHQRQVGPVPLIPALLFYGNQLRMRQGFEVK